MNNLNNIVLANTDYEKIIALLQAVNADSAELLEDELNRAAVVSEEELPEDVVRMNSTVQFEEVETRKQSEVTLVYPHDANLAEQKVSILAPIGSALIGLRVGQVIEWPMPNGRKKSLKVISVQTKF